jgi:hypothetical protein
MNEYSAAPGQEPVSIKELKKRIVPHDEDNPSVEPLFINFAHGLFLADDFYLDVGVITAESIDPSSPTHGTGDFAVLTRLVMSKRTATGLRDQLTDILEKHTKTNAT